MVAFVRSMRVRFRLRLIWLLTGHPRFKPLYRADVVSYDPLEQALFLAGAGYQVAAAMMARNAIENRIKRLCVMSPKWRACRKVSFNHYVAFLIAQNIMGRKTAKQAERFYSFVSQLIHGKVVDYARCIALIDEAAEIDVKFESMTRLILRRESKNVAELAAPLSLNANTRDTAQLPGCI